MNKLLFFHKKYPYEMLLVLTINFLASCNIFFFNNDIKKQFLSTICILLFYFEASPYPFNRKVNIFISYFVFASTLLLTEHIIITLTNKKTLSYNSPSLLDFKIGNHQIKVPLWLLSAYFSMSLILITVFNILQDSSE